MKAKNQSPRAVTLTTDKAAIVRAATAILPTITEEEIRILPISKESKASSVSPNAKFSHRLRNLRDNLREAHRAKRRMAPFPLSLIQETSTETTAEDRVALLTKATDKKGFEPLVQILFSYTISKIDV